MANLIPLVLFSEQGLSDIMHVKGIVS
jgi:hypothetical protein